MITVRTLFLSQQISLKGLLVLSLFLIIGVSLFYLSLATGKSLLSIGAVIDALQGEGKPLNKILVNKLRLPRSMMSFMAGSMLATAGYYMQMATKNPLASPTLTGASDAAAMGAVFFLTIYSDSQGNMLSGYQYLPIFSLTSGLLVLGLVVWLNKFLKGGRTIFILIGITIAIICKAVTSLLMMMAPIYSASQAAVWLSGSVDSATLHKVSIMLPFFVATVLMAILAGRVFKIMPLSPYTVDSIGGNDRIYQGIMILIAGLITAIAVSFTGPIGFVGILAPHIVRKIAPDSLGGLQALQILVFGGFLVLGGDYVGRMIVAPIQIPVGVMTSVIGGIAFLIFFYTKSKTS